MHEIWSDLEDVNGWLSIAVGCFGALSGTTSDLTPGVAEGFPYIS
jgi:hypothetical protein